MPALQRGGDGFFLARWPFPPRAGHAMERRHHSVCRKWRLWKKCGGGIGSRGSGPCVRRAALFFKRVAVCINRQFILAGAPGIVASGHNRGAKSNVGGFQKLRPSWEFILQHFWVLWDAHAVAGGLRGPVGRRSANSARLEAQLCVCPRRRAHAIQSSKFVSTLMIALFARRRIAAAPFWKGRKNSFPTSRIEKAGELRFPSRRKEIFISPLTILFRF